MKRTFTISILCMLFAGISMAGFAQTGKIESEFRIQGSSRRVQEFQPHERGIELKYNVLKNFCLGLNYSTSIALFKLNGVKDYYTSDLLGAKVGYTFLNKSRFSMQVACGAATQVRREGKWNYSCYDVGVYTYVGNGRIRPVMGILLKRYDSHNNVFSDYTRCMLTLGLNTRF